jgi:hypothetical protein
VAANLAKVGIKTTWQANVYKALAGPIGLGRNANIPHPDYDKQWDLGYRRNLVQLVAAVLLWLLFVVFALFQLFNATCDVHNLGTCITSQRTQTFPWDEQEGASHVHLYMRSMQKHLTLKFQACLITNGDYTGYLKNLKMDPPRINPVEGGCEQPTVVNLSSTGSLNRSFSEGGCKLFPNDNAYRYGWCYRMSSPLIGQFGDPAFRFVKIGLHVQTQGLLAANNYTNLDIIFSEFVGGDKDGWNSVYHTFDSFAPMKKEMFFQRVDMIKHSSLEFLTSKTPKPTKTYLQYHHEYNRWEKQASVEQLLAQDTFQVAQIYLRATSSRVVYEERQVKTLYDFPKDAGGFWTAILFIASCCYLCMACFCPVRVTDLPGLLRREEVKKSAHKDIAPEMAEVEQRHIASKPLADRCCSATNDLRYVHTVCSDPKDGTVNCESKGHPCSRSDDNVQHPAAMELIEPPLASMELPCVRWPPQLQSMDNEHYRSSDDKLSSNLEEL